MIPDCIIRSSFTVQKIFGMARAKTVLVPKKEVRHVLFVNNCTIFIQDVPNISCHANRPLAWGQELLCRDKYTDNRKKKYCGINLIACVQTAPPLKKNRRGTVCDLPLIIVFNTTWFFLECVENELIGYYPSIFTALKQRVLIETKKQSMGMSDQDIEIPPKSDRFEILFTEES